MNKLMTLSALSAAALVFGSADSANADHSRNSRVCSNNFAPRVGRIVGNRYDSCTPNVLNRRPGFSISIGTRRGVLSFGQRGINRRGFGRRGFDRRGFDRRDFGRRGFDRRGVGRREFDRHDHRRSRRGH